VTKFVMLLTLICSLLFSNLQLKHQLVLRLQNWFQVWRLVSHHTFFDSLPQTLFGSLLIYNFRLFERQMGSAKFAMFTSLAWLFTTLLQLGALVVLPYESSPGPYYFIFSCFVLFYSDIPMTYPFRICGMKANDKLFTYILGLQLMFSDFPHSFISSICGILAGMIYRSNALQLSKYQFPSQIRNFFRRFVLPLFQSTNNSSNRTPVPTSIGGRINPAVTRTQLVQALLQTQLQQQQQQHQQQQQQQGSSFVATEFENFLSQNDQAQTSSRPPDEEAISVLTGMGFSRQDALQALQSTNNDVQLATNLLLDQ